MPHDHRARRIRRRAYAQTIAIRHHRLISDEAAELGGTDSGPAPTELLLGALASCVAITLQMYAARKGWDPARVEVDLTARDEQGMFVIERRLTFDGDSPTSSGRASPTSPAAARCRGASPAA